MKPLMTICLPSYKEPDVVSFANRIQKEFPEAKVIISHDTEGRGKGWALRQVANQATGWLIFLDGDGDIDHTQIKKLIPYFGEYDIVVGKKELPENVKRKVLSFCSRLWIKLLFGIKVETQTGLKAFNYIPEWATDGWAFDIEILYKAKRAGKRMVEVPVKANVTGTKSLKDIFSSLFDSLKIKLTEGAR